MDDTGTGVNVEAETKAAAEPLFMAEPSARSKRATRNVPQNTKSAGKPGALAVLGSALAICQAEGIEVRTLNDSINYRVILVVSDAQLIVRDGQIVLVSTEEPEMKP